LFYFIFNINIKEVMRCRHPKN